MPRALMWESRLPCGRAIFQNRIGLDTVPEPRECPAWCPAGLPKRQHIRHPEQDVALGVPNAGNPRRIAIASIRQEQISRLDRYAPATRPRHWRGWCDRMGKSVGRMVAEYTDRSNWNLSGDYYEAGDFAGLQPFLL